MMRNLYLLCLLIIPCFAVAQLYNSETCRQKASILRIFLDKNHYAPLPWNDSASVRLYNHWIELLDDDKLSFIQSDMDELQQYKTKLDDELNGKEWGFFDKSMQLYKKALQRRDSLQKLIFSKPLDFSKPDNIHYPFTNYAASVAELQQRLQKLTKWRVLRSIASELDTNNAMQKYLTKIPDDFAAKEVKARERFKKQHDVLMKEFLSFNESFTEEQTDKYLQAISWCYDPHTSYMNITDKKDFTTQLSGFEYSTGMNLTQNENGDYEVDRLEPGGSAWRSGELHKGDVVLKIKKGKGQERELAEMDKDEIQQLLQGSNDETVEVSVKSSAGSSKKITLSKEKITDDEGIVKSYVIHGKQNIGYIQLPGFYSRELEQLTDEEDLKYDGCANDVSKEIVKLKRDTIEGLIIDLRFNGGGSMWEAMQLAGIFIDYGPVGSFKNKEGKVHFLKDPNRGTIYDGPLLVLINGASASASEFTSAVLQDYNRGLIVGSTTYGKGTAQVILPLDTAYNPGSKKNNDSIKDFVKVTEEKFYRVDGSTTQWKGVIPDIELPDLYEDAKRRESSVISALLPDNTKRGIYQSLPALPVELLKSKSYQRVSTDSTFITIKKITDWIRGLDEGRDISLQWQPYLLTYKKGTEMFRSLQLVEDGNIRMLQVSNNNFDKEKINFATPGGKDLNNAHLKRIAADHYVTEAYHIIQDWITK